MADTGISYTQPVGEVIRQRAESGADQSLKSTYPREVGNKSLEETGGKKKTWEQMNKG